VTAQRILATVHFIGLVVPEDRAEGVRWLERAAAQDDAASQYRIGRHLEFTTRISRLPGLPLARTWFQLSAEQDYQTSMRAMARTFLYGPREGRNWELGYKWLTLAAEGGDAESPYILGVLEIVHPDLPQRNIDEARTWLQLAAERGNARASEVLQLELGGKALADAVRFVLKEPYEERYVQRAATRIGDNPTQPPIVYRIVRPIYPPSLRMTHTTGEVLVDFVVDPTGRVTNARVLKTPHPLFGDRALEAVNQWRFHPGRQDGRLVATHMRVPVSFTLGGEQLEGVEGMLSSAASLARRLGGQVAADATELRLAQPIGRLHLPRQADGSLLPADVRAIVLLVLDETGRPVRGHILQAEPERAGPALLASGLAGTFKPRVVNGEAVPSNVLLHYTTGRFKTGLRVD
jgi:TonB family protein